MASSETVMKQGDTAPRLRATLTDDGAPVPLDAATTIRVVMVDEDTSAEVVDSMNVTKDPVEIGVVWYAWQASDTAVPRRMRVEFTVTWADGGEQTFPAIGTAYVQVRESQRYLDPSEV